MLLLSLLLSPIDIGQLDTLAKARDVASLTRYLVSVPKHNPFSILQTGGGYSVGEMGWTAKLLAPADKTATYVVFSTPLIEEDMGELVFKVLSSGKLEYVPETDNLGMLLDGHSFDVSFDLSAKEAFVDDKFTCHWAGSARKHFLFRFSPTFTVKSLKDGAGKPVAFVQAGGVVAVSPGTSFRVSQRGTAGKSGSVGERGSGSLGEGERGFLGFPNALGRLGGFDPSPGSQTHRPLPQRERYESWAVHGGSGTVSVGNTLTPAADCSGELTFDVKYRGRVRKPGFQNEIGPHEATLSGAIWYPMIARRPATYDIAIHSAADWSALAQGDEVSSVVKGGERVTKFKMDVPVVWFGASAGPYKTVVDTIGGREYAVMSASRSEENMHLQNQLNAGVVQYYSDTFCKYPFKRWTYLDSQQFRQGVGALEAYSFATYPAGGDRAGEDGHEPSHTWWGGILNNDYLNSIWNESFANFTMIFLLRNRPGGNAEELAKAYPGGMFYTPAFEAAPLVDSGQEIGPAATALGYGKGAMVLQVLEDEIGTPAMKRCMSEWVKSNPSRHIGRWEDFEAVVGKVMGKSYKWFFDEWARGTGLPDFSLTKATWADGKLTGEVTFKGTPYRIDTEAELEFAGKPSVEARVTIGASQVATFTVDCPEKPSAAVLDPWARIARKEEGEDSRVILSRALEGQVFVSPKAKEMLKPFRFQSDFGALPSDLADKVLIGSPEDEPGLRALFDAAGFSVSGGKLTFDGSTIDLAKGGAMAVVDLPGGKRCAIGIGNCKLHPNFGYARLAVFDELGRVIRARTEPALVAGMRSEVSGG